MITSRKVDFTVTWCAAMLLLTGSAYAEDNVSSWYLGVDGGWSENSIDHAAVTRGLADGGITTGGGLATSSISDSNGSTQFALYGGWQLNRYVAFEAGFFDLGKLGYTATTVPTGTLTGNLKVHGENLDVLARYPLDELSSLYARLGVIDTNAETDFSSTGAVSLLRTSYSGSNAGYKFGVGLARKLPENWTVHLEADRYRVDDALNKKEVISTVSVGLIYHF